MGTEPNGVALVYFVPLHQSVDLGTKQVVEQPEPLHAEAKPLMQEPENESVHFVQVLLVELRTLALDFLVECGFLLGIELYP